MICWREDAASLEQELQREQIENNDLRTITASYRAIIENMR